MKYKINAIITAAALLATALDAKAQGTAFTYQGRLNDGASPGNGNYSLRFTLYDASTGGNLAAGPVTNTPVAVSDGLFTVPVDFGPGAFSGGIYGTTYWLQIDAAPSSDSPSFTPLTPRQQVTPTPLAMYAGTAAFAGTAYNTYGNSVNTESFSTSGGSPVPGKVLGINSGGALDWITPSSTSGGSGWSLSGNYGTAPSANFLGTMDNAALSLRVNNSQALLLVPNPSGPNLIGGSGNSIGSSYFASVIAGGGQNQIQADYSIIGGGTGNHVAANYGTIGGGANNSVMGWMGTIPGGYNNSASGQGSFAAGQNAHTSYDGNFVWGDGTRAAIGSGPNMFDVLATGGVNFFTGPSAKTSINSGGDLTFGAQTRQMLDLYNSDYGIGVQNYTLYERTGVGGGFAWYSGGTHSDGSFDPGGGTTLMTLSSSGDLFPIGGLVAQWAVIANGLNGTSAEFSGNLRANTATFSGSVSACSVTIRGGCDVAEPFAMAEDHVQQGSVVIIDDENPGRLKMSDGPYDTRVAGIVSGANGVNPGISLHQEGVIEGGQNVALSGRVYVQADTSNGPINPGDLLTTSSTPGHAMRASDHTKAQGAILGKAMTGLKESQGMVLVLVTLE